MAAFAYIFKGKMEIELAWFPRMLAHSYQKHFLPPSSSSPSSSPSSSSSYYYYYCYCYCYCYSYGMKTHPRVLASTVFFSHMPISFVPRSPPVLWHFCSPHLYTCSLAVCSTAMFLSARLFLDGSDLYTLQMCSSCSGHLSIVFVTYHNICYQITQHCCESIKYVLCLPW